VFRDTADLVNVLVTVRDRNNHLIPALDKSSFTVFENGEPQEIKFFGREDVPLTMGLLIDTGPGQFGLLSSERDASKEFFSTVLREKDLAFLINFGTNVNLVTDFTGQLNLLWRGLEQIREGGISGRGPFPSGIDGEHLHDAIYLAADEKLSNEIGRKALIIVASGNDQGSKWKLDEAIAAAQRAEATVYAVRYINKNGCAAGPLGISMRHALQKIAGETGGRVLEPDTSEELHRAYQEIAEELHNQYSIGYSPANPKRDGSFRKIELKVNQPGMKIQCRKGYFALPTGER
jgi:VWFA-related protein